MRPKDFWRMTPAEFHWLMEAKRPRTMYGKMTEDEVEAIYAEAYGDDDD